MENIDDIVNRCKGKGSKIPRIKLSKYITKFLLSVLFILGSLIYVKISDENKALYKENVLTSSMSFTSFNSMYEKYFGEVLPTVKESSVVFSDSLSFTSIDTFHDGEVLTVDNSSPVSNIMGGIVVFIGEKDNYGQTVIVQGNDGHDIWYGNLTNIGVGLYDYLDSQTILGETTTDELYLVIKKNDEFIKYEDYKN